MKNGNIPRSKMAENGIKTKPSYSVETPYGFQIDLDFLKYVDDIEKGNTIKRVPIQRRSKGPRASTLPRQLNPSGAGCRPSPWGSMGALGPRAHHHGYSSAAYNRRATLSPTGLNTLSEMEARIKEFDEQPLGEHIRPHLLRASSLPLTVLLRQESESTEDRSSLRSSRDHLGGVDTSSEDVFLSADSPRPQDCSGLLRRLTEALERVGELEMEVRIIPELRAQICILQEERERLRLDLGPHTPASKMNGTTEPGLFPSYGKVEVKGCRDVTPDVLNTTREWKSSTDLDELLTVTSLQAKVAVLEQKLHETQLDHQRLLGLLKEQREESKRKDEKMEHLIRNPSSWVRAEKVVVDQDGDETVVRASEPDPDPEKTFSFICTKTVTPDVQKHHDSVTFAESLASAEGEHTKEVIHNIRRIQGLLDEQWGSVCGGSGGDRKALQHPDPKVTSLQHEMMELTDVLMSHHKHQGDTDGEEIQTSASKSSLKTNGSVQRFRSLHSNSANDGFKKTSSGNVLSQDSVKKGSRDDFQQKGSSSFPGRTDAVQADEKKDGEAERRPSPEGHMTSLGTESEWTDRGGAKQKTPGELMEGKSETKASTVSPDFMSACHFLRDHLDNMDNPSNDTRKALVTLFEHWFRAAAEESSDACRVAAYLKEVRRLAPSLLAFLVNLADDNGNTVLHYSVSNCNYSIVSLLLDTGVTDMNVQNNAGYTAVMLASLTAPDGPGGMEVVRKLMELGDVNVRSTQTGQTALHLAVRHGRVVMVRLLLSCGADANIQDNQGTTALMFASERGHTHIARLLLERSQCGLLLSDKRGRTALSIAMQGSHTDTAALLQAHAKARAVQS
ncbi:KN motif and ankyrin repeat domain-containing protein 4 isoform X2 [Austrofundulus limnaeus]|uniref:KN motif and ankyrin repeat domain-containing protein 4 isoform X2 n=1 Tax=Austrofundulus limnaeus TaxID=52670 RepID=A0A2I4BXB3_AUSLI|nr:PREDICTED: KN motif and ankyrin repeat domain-containing protein 4-like isoform X2 [Austrofundulus limnaeus]